MLTLERTDFGWHLSAPSHAQFWQYLAEGHGDEFMDLVCPVETSGIFWECAPVFAERAHAPFDSVILPTREFDLVEPDPAPFAEYLQEPGAEVRVFDSIGGDATLICPTNSGPYGHLLSFARSASSDLSKALWKRTAQTVMPFLEEDIPVWVSTHGLGVPWLHIRIDRRPKYYHHRPFKRVPRTHR